MFVGVDGRLMLDTGYWILDTGHWIHGGRGYRVDVLKWVEIESKCVHVGRRLVTLTYLHGAYITGSCATNTRGRGPGHERLVVTVDVDEHTQPKEPGSGWEGGPNE